MSETTVAVVTGGSRGAGRGIALALGSYGCTVYVTGRTERADQSHLAGTIGETAQGVTDAGGRGIAVRVDHTRDAETKALIERVHDEQGKIDILVNNACALNDHLTDPGNFWEKPLGLVDMLDVGLRSGYVASYYAAPRMVERRRGLVVFTSSSGGAQYFFGPAYGAHKAGMDKFAADMAVDFKDFDVAAVSIWMGGLVTERVERIFAADPVKYKPVMDRLETPEFTGHIIWALFNDPKLMERSGQTLIGAELALEYGIRDKDGNQPPSARKIHGVAPHVQGSQIVR